MQTMTDDPTSKAFARLRARVEALLDALGAANQSAHAATLEMEQWKRRCYPTPTDVLDAKVTRAKCEAWMDATFERKMEPRVTMEVAFGGEPFGGDDEVRQTWRDRDPDEPALVAQAEWRSTEHEHRQEIARLIVWAADGQALDQWDVLAQMAAMEVGATP